MNNNLWISRRTRGGTAGTASAEPPRVTVGSSVHVWLREFHFLETLKQKLSILKMLKFIFMRILNTNYQK